MPPSLQPRTHTHKENPMIKVTAKSHFVSSRVCCDFAALLVVLKETLEPYLFWMAGWSLVLLLQLCFTLMQVLSPPLLAKKQLHKGCSSSTSSSRASWPVYFMAVYSAHPVFPCFSKTSSLVVMYPQQQLQPPNLKNFSPGTPAKKNEPQR